MLLYTGRFGISRNVELRLQKFPSLYVHSIAMLNPSLIHPCSCLVCYNLWRIFYVYCIARFSEGTLVR